MKIPKRFALSTLLLVMLLVSLVFGYAQWRKQQLTTEIASIREQYNVVVDLSDNWFWPTVPKHATIRVFNYRGPDVVEVESRLKGIGVEQVEVSYSFLSEELKPLKPFPQNYLSGDPFN